MSNLQPVPLVLSLQPDRQDRNLQGFLALLNYLLSLPYPVAKTKKHLLAILASPIRKYSGGYSY